jgi:hypothetical protein
MKFFGNLSLNLRFRFGGNDMLPRVGLSEASLCFNTKLPFIQERYVPPDDAPAYVDLPHYFKWYLFLREVWYYNDEQVNRWDYSANEDIVSWEFSDTRSKEPNDHNRMKVVEYHLPFTKIELIYETAYSRQCMQECLNRL